MGWGSGAADATAARGYAIFGLPDLQT